MVRHLPPCVLCNRKYLVFVKKDLILDVPDYWPEVKTDLTKVIWSHATNSKSKLQQAFQGTIFLKPQNKLSFFI